MPAGSLIFVIIVAIWAAYLLQHWVRRQENSAAARSVDRFSKAMRVLERPPAVSEPEPIASHSHIGSPVRVIRPAVDVKRATPAGDSRRSPLVARSSTEAVLDSHEVEPMQHQTYSPDPHPAPRVPLRQRRLRAALLLTALAWVPTSVVLVVLDLLLWISIPFSLLTVIAVVVWLRTEANADRARRSGQGHHHRQAQQHVLSSDDTQVIRADAVAQAAAAAAAAQPHGTHVAVTSMTSMTSMASRTAMNTMSARSTAAVARASVVTGTGGHHAEQAGPSVAEASQTAYETVFDGEAARSQPVPVAEPAEGTWAPVPVPRPTYAMKAKAEPRMTPSGIPADVFDTPEFAEEAEELDERALFARRAVSE
ncbi:MAG TPA: hypothetical protein VFT81_05700, partial [Dermatophilaceae bacterium]|nr:hypothetical protein [Dermatophilaceae bacterium]